MVEEQPAEPMPRPKPAYKLVEVRISEEALAAVRQVIGYTNETASAYMTRALLTQARLDRDAEHERAKLKEAEKEGSGEKPDPK